MSQFGTDPLHAIPAARALRRSRGRWRIVAFIALAVAVVAGLARFGPDIAGQQPYVAQINISGTITTSQERMNMFSRIAEDDRVQAVVVTINSPGGTIAGGEELYVALRALSEARPTVAVIHELGASAAYMTAIGTDRIFARRLSIVGSIGVLYRHVDAGRLLDTIGINLEKIASGELKAEPEFDAPMNPAVRESLAALVEDSFSWFVDLVAERRDMSRAEILALADGRIMTGAMGLDAGLIDQIGGQAEALEWLVQTHGIGLQLPVSTVWPPPSRRNWVSLLLGEGVSQVFGFDIDTVMTLDGLVSVWHPSN